jgi:hypothetical protein
MIKNDEILRKLIKEIKLDSPSDGFTENVMKLCYSQEVSLSKFKLFNIWFKKSLPYITAILIFIIVTAALLIFNISIEPDLITNFFETIGLGFLNILSTIKLVSIGVIFGVGSSILLIYNKIKQSNLVTSL